MKQILQKSCNMSKQAQKMCQNKLRKSINGEKIITEVTEQ